MGEGILTVKPYFPLLKVSYYLFAFNPQTLVAWLFIILEVPSCRALRCF